MIDYILIGLLGFGVSTAYFKAKEFIINKRREVIFGKHKFLTKKSDFFFFKNQK